MSETNLRATETALVCDLSTGQCGPGEHRTRRVTVTYVTDPICSACWVMEPAWRAVRARYGDLMDVQHVYGGLLPSWDGFADPANGIRAFGDVGMHWREMARHTGQAIDASVWDTDPIDSSFPPSMVLSAARDVAPAREELALRRMREQLFIRGRNISRPEVWTEAITEAGIDVGEVAARIADGRARDMFTADLQRARALRASAFPTLIVESDGDRVTLRGAQSLERLDRVIADALGADDRRQPLSLDHAIAALDLGTTAEYAAVLGLSHTQTQARLTSAGVRRLDLEGGTAWRP